MLPSCPWDVPWVGRGVSQRPLQREPDAPRPVTSAPCHRASEERVRTDRRWPSQARRAHRAARPLDVPLEKDQGPPAPPGHIWDHLRRPLEREAGEDDGECGKSGGWRGGWGAVGAGRGVPWGWKWPSVVLEQPVPRRRAELRAHIRTQIEANRSIPLFFCSWGLFPFFFF
uniref:Uncharacterized protein n=1 Tax=Rousettus aegyptiacus TaxID=9407 RepID=A0A7J8H1W6_ROUAE|nr:hypothetical protein HJG63_011435 [Rousettus aegyptiacus]